VGQTHIHMIAVRCFSGLMDKLRMQQLEPCVLLDSVFCPIPHQIFQLVLPRILKLLFFSGANQAVPASGTSFFPAQPVTITNPVGIIQDAAFGTYTLPAGNWLVDWSGDIDNTGTASTINLTITASLQVNGANISPFLSNTCTGPNASNTLACHAAITIPWFVQSNGTTTVRVNCTATYAAAGVVDIDSIIRFTAV